MDDARLSTLDTRFAAIGMLPGSMGAALLPSAAATAAAALASGEWDALPEAWGFVRDAWLGRDVRVRGAFNIALLAGDARALGDAISDPDPGVRAHAASVVYRMGGDAELATTDASIDPRVRAYAIATLAHAQASRGLGAEAVDGLRAAAEAVASISPCAAARYVGEAAAVAELDPRSLHELQRAAGWLEGLGFESLRGELLMAAADGMLSMGAERPALLQQAIQLLQKATQALPRRTQPVSFAVCHMNIAVAYLSMPMNAHAGKLRGAIAVQSLREALEIVTADEHPELWESATLNLANALQHLPSAHPGQNMLESIELYGQVLERRSEATLARARTLASKANALAHLGRYDEVRPMLVEAKSIFEQSRDAAGLAGIDAIEAEMLACPASVGEASHG
ncbi:MAG: hypothetical protein HRU13_08775 [Phycisphaerales bacterium]|nr:hypothetical protein [Phycisphaerales bacterium]